MLLAQYLIYCKDKIKSTTILIYSGEIFTFARDVDKQFKALLDIIFTNMAL